MTLYGVEVQIASPTAQLVATAAADAFIPLAQNAQDQWSMVQTDAIWNNGGTLEEAQTFSAAVGLGTGPVVPSSVALLLRKESTVVGKHGHGRMYLPGLADGARDASGNSLTPTALAAWQTAANTFFAALTGSLIPMFILHKSPLVPPTAVRDLLVESLLAGQSRRLRKVARK